MSGKLNQAELVLFFAFYDWNRPTHFVNKHQIIIFSVLSGMRLSDMIRYKNAACYLE